MKYLLSILLLSISACGPVANSPSKPTSSTTVTEGTDKVLTSKQAYIDFLTCTKKVETSASAQATIQAGIDNVKEIPDAAWETIKTNLSISAKDFVSLYPTCANE